MTVYWCTHCGKERPVAPGYTPVDDKYAIVACQDRIIAPDATLDNVLFEDSANALFEVPMVAVTVHRPGISDPIAAKAIRKERARKSKARTAKILGVMGVDSRREMTATQKKMLDRVKP